MVKLCTSSRLYLCLSHRSLDAISVFIYHPLNGQPVNSNPPQSNFILATAGIQYHFKPSSAKPGNLSSIMYSI